MRYVLVLLGDAEVGKTQIQKVLAGKEFVEDYKPTRVSVPVNRFFHIGNSNDKVKTEVIDIGSKTKAIHAQWLSVASVIFLVYDVT